MDKQKEVISGKFIWSKWKSDQNIKIGRPPFSAAKSVFKDKYRLYFDVSRLVDNETRLAVYGKSQSGKLLYVVYCLRGKRMRIISVRENRQLRRVYEQRR
ncbi:MAG: BrnT family toxin [Opitutales bacterium]